MKSRVKDGEIVRGKRELVMRDAGVRAIEDVKRMAMLDMARGDDTERKEMERIGSAGTALHLETKNTSKSGEIVVPGGGTLAGMKERAEQRGRSCLVTAE